MDVQRFDNCPGPIGNMLAKVDEALNEGLDDERAQRERTRFENEEIARRLDDYIEREMATHVKPEADKIGKFKISRLNY